MKNVWKQLLALGGAGFAAAACAGVPLVLTALTAAGLGFLINDYYLIPIFLTCVGLSVWLFRRTRRAKRI